MIPCSYGRYLITLLHFLHCINAMDQDNIHVLMLAETPRAQEAKPYLGEVAVSVRANHCHFLDNTGEVK